MGKLQQDRCVPGGFIMHDYNGIVNGATYIDQRV